MIELTAKEIRDRRVLLGLTQKQMAEKCGMPLRTYIMYENKDSKHSGKRYADILVGLEIIEEDAKSVPDEKEWKLRVLFDKIQRLENDFKDIRVFVESMVKEES